MTKSLLPNNWGYKNLLTYQKSDVIYRILTTSVINTCGKEIEQ